MRAFIALPVAGDALDGITRLQQYLPEGRPLPEENLHLTLAFLDDQPEESLEALHEDLSGICAPGFAVPLRGLALFGQALAVEAEPVPPLAGLQTAVQAAARRAGIALPRRRFRPHVTFARLKGRGAGLSRYISENAATRLPDLQAAAFSLFASTLRPQGALHEELARYPLVRA